MRSSKVKFCLKVFKRESCESLLMFILLVFLSYCYVFFSKQRTF